MGMWAQDSPGDPGRFRRGPFEPDPGPLPEEDIPLLPPRFLHDAPVRAALVSRDGKILISLDSEGTVTGWDLRSGRRLYSRRALDRSELPQTWTGSPDGRLAALSPRSPPASLVRVILQSTGQELRRMDRCFSPAFSPDGEMLAGSDGKSVRRWSIRSGAELPGLEEADAELKGVAYSPQGNCVAASHLSSDAVTMWDVATRRKLKSPATPSSKDGQPATSLAFTPDGKRLAVGNHWGIRYCRMTDEESKPWVSIDEYSAGALRFSGDGRRIIAVVRQKTLRIWDVASGEDVLSLKVSPATDGTLDLSDNGNGLIWSDGVGIRLERIPTPLGGRREDHVVTSVGFTSDGKAITGDDQGTVRWWNPSTEKEERRYAAAPWRVSFFSQDGAWAILGGRRDPVLVWDLVGGREILKPEGLPWAESVALSPDRTTLALGLADGSVSLWDTGTKREKKRIRMENTGITAIRWSPDGRSLAWGDDRGSVVLVEGARALDPLQFKPRGEAIRDLAFTRDGKSLLTFDSQGVVRAYAGELGREPVVLRRWSGIALASAPDPRWRAGGMAADQTAGFVSTAFSPDGNYAITATRQGTALIWQAPWLS